MRRIRRTNALEELFAVWADEYCDEKDFIQKEEMVNWLNEKYGVQIEWTKVRKEYSWEGDMSKYREKIDLK